jgi:5-methylcytosine-specific restriction endonuclease McrA
MQGIETKLLVLKLNKFWKVVDTALVGDALVDLAAGKNSYALDINYGEKEDGSPDFSNPQMRPVNWDEWILLPVRPWDFSIKSVKMEIRVPTILVAKNYAKVPEVKFGKNPSSDQIRIRDGNRCQYTGQKLKREEISIDHVLPRSKGGDNSWGNLVVTSKALNSMKGDKLNSEVGLKLIATPGKPKPIPRYKLIREARHADWKLFLEEIDD